MILQGISMPFDAERLRDIALAGQARNEQAALEAQEERRRELARFKSETLAPFFEWLNVQLERQAEEGWRSVTLRFGWVPQPDEMGRTVILGRSVEYDEDIRDSFIPLSPEHLFLVGPYSLPTYALVECVIESLRKAGLAADQDEGWDRPPDVKLAW